VLARSIETGIPVVEANVGVTLIASGGRIVAVEREKTTITYGEIVIDEAAAPNPPERDRVEMRFLRERMREMPRRYQDTMRKLRKRPAAPGEIPPRSKSDATFEPALPKAFQAP
jgi:hypothetical protein